MKCDKNKISISIQAKQAKMEAVVAATMAEEQRTIRDSKNMNGDTIIVVDFKSHIQDYDNKNQKAKYEIKTKLCIWKSSYNNRVQRVSMLFRFRISGPMQ